VHTRAVKALLENGASLNSEVLVSACYSIWPTQSTPLHIAAAKGSFSIVKYLLQAQVRVYLRTPSPLPSQSNIHLFTHCKHTPGT